MQLKEKEYSHEIADAIRNFLDEDDWRYSFDETAGTFRFTLSINGKIKRIDYRIKVRTDDFLVNAYPPIGADEDDKEMMASMTEFICRCNYGLCNGCFEMDFRDGEIRYRSYVDCENLQPSPEVIRNSIYNTASKLKKYSPGIVDIIFTGISAEEAENRCERSGRSEIYQKLMGMEVDPGSAEESLLSALRSEFESQERESSEAEGEA